VVEVFCVQPRKYYCSPLQDRGDSRRPYHSRAAKSGAINHITGPGHLWLSRTNLPCPATARLTIHISPILLYDFSHREESLIPSYSGQELCGCRILDKLFEVIDDIGYRVDLSRRLRLSGFFGGAPEDCDIGGSLNEIWLQSWIDDERCSVDPFELDLPLRSNAFHRSEVLHFLSLHSDHGLLPANPSRPATTTPSQSRTTFITAAHRAVCKTAAARGRARMGCLLSHHSVNDAGQHRVLQSHPDRGTFPT
jgi:hypothetical protein